MFTADLIPYTDRPCGLSGSRTNRGNSHNSEKQATEWGWAAASVLPSLSSKPKWDLEG